MNVRYDERRMRPSLRKLMLTVHVLVSVGWFGAAASVRGSSASVTRATTASAPIGSPSPSRTSCAPSNVSVFAGRIADTGRDPVPLMAEAVDILKTEPKAELIWASPRELLNIFQADAIGCHIITVTHDILKRLSLIGKSLDDYSLETVKMFYEDATAAGYSLDLSPTI